MEHVPTISVLLPTFNSMPYLSEAVESVLAQTYTDFTLVIIDNGSNDGTSEYLAGLRDRRVKVLSEAERGIGFALNKGLRAVSSPFIARMDADDVADPTRLQVQLEYLQTHTEVVLVGTWFRFIVGKQRISLSPLPVSHNEIRRQLLLGSVVICHPATMFRRQCALSVGGYRLGGPGEELDFFLRMGENGALRNLPSVLHNYRLHEGSISIRRMVDMRFAHAYAIGCAKARLRSEDEPDLHEVYRAWQTRSRFRRLCEYMDSVALCMYRAAIVSYARRNFVMAMLTGAIAAAASPKRTWLNVERRLQSLDCRRYQSGG